MSLRHRAIVGVSALVVVVALVYTARTPLFSHFPSTADRPVSNAALSASIAATLSSSFLGANTAFDATDTVSAIASSTPQDSAQPATSKSKTAAQSLAPAPSSETASATISATPTYDTAPQSFDTVNTTARAALVNILCMPRAGGSLNPISGSGVIIDPRGVILTNAHVAQYILLSEDPRIDLSCQIRSGSPAVAEWRAEVMYIPPVWVENHAGEINQQRTMGNGSHDYALIRITASVDSSPLPASFPYISVDTRENITTLGEKLLGASYPVELIGGYATENNLYPVSSVSMVEKLFTLSSSTLDEVSIGGVIEAQSGSSGGAVVNAWGKLIGIITTTSEGATTASRDLRAITLSYINRDFKAQTGLTLDQYLGIDPAFVETQFNAAYMQGLVQEYTKALSQQ